MYFDKLYVDGQWTQCHSGQHIEVENPATMQVIGAVPRGGKVDVDHAVDAARLAFDGWSKTSMDLRIKLMKSVLEYLENQRERLVKIELNEIGAPIRWAEAAHVRAPLSRIRNYIRLMESYKFEVMLDRSRVVKEPVGVIGCITPWNYPLGQIVQKVIPAILCGNTVVLKPSQIAPLSAMVLAEAFESAGVPGGVFNVVTGKAGEVGNALATHPQVDMISFTGSTQGGKEVGKLALESIKKIALELGGKSANIILKGADYSEAVKAGLGSCFDNAGQTCAAWTRMLVPREDLELIHQLILEHSKTFTVGSPDSIDVKVGPVVSRKQYDKVRGYILKGLEEGAEMLLGEVPPAEPQQGYFVQPIVFTNVNNSMAIARDEIFGPVVCVIAYDTVEEAIKIANDTPYGLAGAVFGPESDAKKVALAMRTGTVYVNNGKRDMDAPFGGYKQSGIGREGGHWGIEEFLEIKAVFDFPNTVTPL